MRWLLLLLLVACGTEADTRIAHCHYAIMECQPGTQCQPVQTICELDP